MNSCRVCLSFVSNVVDISQKTYNGRNLLSVFNELVNIFIEKPCFLCPMCERGLRFTYDFRKKAVKSAEFFETEIKIEIPEEEIATKDEAVTKTCSYRACRYCLKPFKALKKHEASHILSNNGLECHFCQKRFFGRQEIIAHINNVHLRDTLRRFYCDKCEKSFSALSTLVSHRKAKHEIQSFENIFKCFHCEKAFGEKNLLKRHIRRVHNNNGNKAQCHDCGKWFKSKTSLKTHIGIHLQKLFICEICKKGFSTLANRINHMRTHTQHFSFACLDCNLSFNTNANLQRHRINLHTTIFKHPCPSCNKHFKTSTGLKLHQSTHNAPEFSCQICEKRFTRNQGLKEHIFAIHLGRKLSCSSCNAEFSRRDALLKHQKAFH